MTGLGTATRIDVAIALLQLVALTLPVLMIFLQVIMSLAGLQRLRGFMNPEELRSIGIRRSLVSGSFLIVSVLVLGGFLVLALLWDVYLSELIVLAIVLQAAGFLTLLSLLYSVYVLSRRLTSVRHSG